ncbi:MAG: hypothetical protein GY838_17085 [bacterium]|nr:hypothetical protein [bacterium]
MHSRSSPCGRRPRLSALTVVVLLLLTAGICRAQNPVDPANSFVEVLCDFNLLTGPGGGDPLGDLGLVVHCYDDMGLPLSSLPGSAFDVVNLSGTMVKFGSPVLATLDTDDEGRIFLTERLAASATLVHGAIAVEVSIGGQEVLIDNGGSGYPVEFRTADLNHDGIVNLTDVVILATAFGCCEDTESCLQCDYDGDGCVSLADRTVFADAYYGVPKRGPGSPVGIASVDTTLFSGCIQRDFDDDGDPATLRDEVILAPGGIVGLRLVATEFLCLTGADFEMVLPSTMTKLGPVSVLAPFRDLQEHPAPVGSVRASMTAPHITSGPEFMCQILLQSSTGGTYRTEDFDFTSAVFSDCHYPPREITACIGTPTPCEMSYVVQDSDQYITCPGDDLSLPDTVTVVMRDQTGAGVAGLPAGGFRITLSDTAGSGRADTYSLTPLASTTDTNGELDFLFEPRGVCRWPDACLGLDMGFRYEACSLNIHKTVQTLNLVRWETGDGAQDLIDDDDIDQWNAAKFTRNWCLDLTRTYRCPVVTQGSIDIALAHYLDGCDISDVPVPASGALAWLHQNIPNPFNPSTELRLTLPARAEWTEVTVHDLKGRLVRRLWDGPLPAGTSRVVWDGRDTGGRSVGSGIYLARFQALGRTESIRMALLR